MVYWLLRLDIVYWLLGLDIVYGLYGLDGSNYALLERLDGYYALIERLYWLLVYNGLLNLRSLNLIFNFIIFNSFNLSRLSNIFSSFLSNVFSSLNGNVFNSFDGDLFLNGVVNSSGDIFFLIFNSLVISPDSFFRNLFDVTFGYGFVFNNGFGYLFLI